jgi:hypothetical protein
VFDLASQRAIRRSSFLAGGSGEFSRNLDGDGERHAPKCAIKWQNATKIFICVKKNLPLVARYSRISTLGRGNQPSADRP